MDVQKKIKEMMQERGWSNYRLAKEAGLSPSTVSNLFLRNNAPTFTTLTAICKAFGVSLSLFITEMEGKNLLTDEQRLLLSKWDKLSSEQKKALLLLIDTM